MEARIGQVSEIRLRNKLYHPTQATLQDQAKPLTRGRESSQSFSRTSSWALRRLVNTLKESRDKIDSNFEFDEIHIELTRDL